MKEVYKEYTSKAISGKTLKDKLREIAAGCEGKEDAEVFWKAAEEVNEDGVYVEETSWNYYTLDDYTKEKGADFVEKYVGGKP